MRTITLSAMVFVLLSAAATTLQANGPMGNTSGASGVSKPVAKAPPTTRSPSCAPGRQTSSGRTNCHGWAGPQVNPGYDYPRYIPGYVSGPAVINGVRPQPAIIVRPGSGFNGSGFQVPHLGVVPGSDGPKHSFVIFPDGSIGQRFDTDPGRYVGAFPNMDAFRNQEFPIGSGRHPYTGTTFHVHCAPNCTQRH